MLFVFQTFGLGGSERQACLLADHLVQHHGSTVEVLASDEAGPARNLLQSSGIHTDVITLRRPHPSIGSWWRLQQVKARLRARRPDLLLPVTSTPNVACGLAWRAVGARACIWRQGDAGLALSGRRLERRAARACSLVVANSDEGASFVRETLGVPAARVRRIRNAVVVPDIAADPAPWRERLGADAQVVTMLASLERPKDHWTLLDAWRRVILRSARPPLLVLAGRPGSTAAEIEARIDELRIRDRVRVVGAVDDVGGLLGATDLCVHASHREGVPNAVLEAMAHGRPVVATDLPGTREALGEDGSDDLVPVGDADALAGRILLYLASAEARRVQGEQNRERVRAGYDATRVLDATSLLLATTLAGA